MGKNLKGKELGKGITQRKNGVYHGRYVDRFGARRSVYGTTVKEVKAKLAEAELNEQKLSNIVDEKITLDEWYENGCGFIKSLLSGSVQKLHTIQCIEG